MQRTAIIGAKAAITAIWAFSLALQVLVVPLVAGETVHAFPEVAHLRVPGIVGCVAVIACGQFALACMWRLLTMVGQERVFRRPALRLVDAIVAAALAAAGLLVAATVVLDSADAMSPGIGALLAIGAVACVGIALLLVVMRRLLVQATAMEQDLAAVV